VQLSQAGEAGSGARHPGGGEEAGAATTAPPDVKRRRYWILRAFVAMVAELCNSDGWNTKSRETLAECFGVSVREVDRLTGEAIGLGLLEKRARRETTGFWNKTNVYRVLPAQRPLWLPAPGGGGPGPAWPGSKPGGPGGGGAVATTVSPPASSEELKGISSEFGVVENTGDKAGSPGGGTGPRGDTPGSSRWQGGSRGAGLAAPGTDAGGSGDQGGDLPGGGSDAVGRVLAVFKDEYEAATGAAFPEVTASVRTGVARVLAKVGGEESLVLVIRHLYRRYKGEIGGLPRDVGAFALPQLDWVWTRLVGEVKSKNVSYAADPGASAWAGWSSGNEAEELHELMAQAEARRSRGE